MSQNYINQLIQARESAEYLIDQRTDQANCITWIRKTKGTLEELFGQDSRPVREFIEYVALLREQILGDLWIIRSIQDFLNEKINEVKLDSNMDKETEVDCRFDIAIVCALHEPELKALFYIGNWEPKPISNSDPHSYYVTTWESNNGQKLKVIAGAPNFMGLTATGVLAAKMIWKFRPKLVAISGIAAGGNETDQGFGDILAPDHTFDYGSSKIVQTKSGIELLPNTNPLQLNPCLLGRLKEWKQFRTGLDDIVNSWQSERPKTQLNIHVGPMISAPTVIDAAEPLNDIKKHWRKLIGLEMEAHAVHRACHDTVTPAPMFLCLKSICDFAENKNDAFQHYAAFTSAQLLNKFLIKEWENLFQ